MSSDLLLATLTSARGELIIGQSSDVGPSWITLDDSEEEMSCQVADPDELRGAAANLIAAYELVTKVSPEMLVAILPVGPVKVTPSYAFVCAGCTVLFTWDPWRKDGRTIVAKISFHGKVVNQLYCTVEAFTEFICKLRAIVDEPDNER